MAENNLIEVGRLTYSKGHIISGLSGALTALSASAVVAAIRNVGPAEVIVDSIDQAFMTTVAASTAGSLAFGVYKVPGFSALLGTGARAVAPVAVRKRISDHFALPANTLLQNDPKFDTAVQAQVGSTTALSGLTLSPALVVDDPQAVMVCNAVNNAAAGAFLHNGRSRWEPRNHIPMTLGPSEGLVFTTIEAFPTTLAGRYFFSVDLHIA